MINGIKTMLKMFGVVLATAPDLYGTGIKEGVLEEKYDDIEIVQTEEVVREVDDAQLETTLVTIKNTGDKLINPLSVTATTSDVKAYYSWKDNTGLNCLIDKNETFVFSISNYLKSGNILDYVSVRAIDKNVRTLWTRSISGFHGVFSEKSNGDYDYSSLEFHFYIDENNPYKDTRKYDVLELKGLAYYAIDGVTHTSYIYKDTLNIRSHDSLENVDISILKIDYFYVSAVKLYQNTDSATPKLNLDLSPLFNVPLIIIGSSILGAGLVVGAAFVAKRLVDKKSKKNSNS